MTLPTLPQARKAILYANEARAGGFEVVAIEFTRDSVRIDVGKPAARGGNDAEAAERWLAEQLEDET